ncbi:molybdopterin dinucleotide binding domain-containing protein [Shigella flexneri]
MAFLLTYSDNLLMLTLGRGGPVVWMSEEDAKEIGIEDNDWIEVFNNNGAPDGTCNVSQRVPAGMTMMYHAQERFVRGQVLDYSVNAVVSITQSTRITPNLPI